MQFEGPAVTSASIRLVSPGAAKKTEGVTYFVLKKLTTFLVIPSAK